MTRNIHSYLDSGLSGCRHSTVLLTTGKSKEIRM